MSHLFKCGRFDLNLSQNAWPLVMGILNVTPDSFSDGGNFFHLEAAISHAEQMIADGVDIIDIGAESSRPGAIPLPLDEELARIMPVVYALRDCGKPLSIDTYKPAVMREVLAAGVDMINDIRAFQEPGAVEAVAGSDCGLCLVHMQDVPQTMQVAPHYEDVEMEVTAFLHRQAMRLSDAGVDRKRLCIDPGFGFGKTLIHNMALWENLKQIRDTLGLPLLAGVSRKAMIGSITGRDLKDRMVGSVVAALAAAEQGVRIVRVHDVAETIDAFAVWHALQPVTPNETDQGLSS